MPRCLLALHDAHTHSHMILISSCIHEKTQQAKALPPAPTRTIACIYFHYGMSTITIYMCAGRLAISLPTRNSRVLHPPPLRRLFISSPFLPLISLFTPARPTARSHTSITPCVHMRTHTRTQNKGGSVVCRKR